MRLLHIADLHIGKRVCEFSMLADQRHVLEQVLGMLREHKADALLVAGDLYDKSLPSAEAVALVDWFLSEVAATGIPAVVIPGNHDAAERVAYAGGVLARQGVHVAPVFDGRVEPVELADEHGPVRIWPIPFLRPAAVRHYFPDENIESYTDALRVVVGSLELGGGVSAADAAGCAAPSGGDAAGDAPADATGAGSSAADGSEAVGGGAAGGVRNVAVAHQFVTAGGASPERSDSEVSVGGLDNVDASAFDAFDYVALGHLHRPQCVGRDAVRYAGSILKYSASEAADGKSAVLVELGEPGSKPAIELVPLAPLHDLRRIRGPLGSLVASDVVAAADADDYLHVVLTDENPVLDAIARLRAVYPNVMSVEYDNARTRAAGLSAAAELPAEEDVAPLELFAEFYEHQNGSALSDGQRALVAKELEGIEVR